MRFLNQRYADRATAVDAIKLHSTQQGRRVTVNVRKSNSMKVHFECATQSKPCRCKYHVVLRKSKSKKFKCLALPWGLSQNTKLGDLQHDITCTSRAQITFREVRSVLQASSSRKLSRIEDVADRIADDANITLTSVSAFVAAKTRLAEAHQNNEDYYANWSKLKAWGSEFENNNPGSHTAVQVDDRSHFRKMFVGFGSAGRVAENTGTRKDRVRVCVVDVS